MSVPAAVVTTAPVPAAMETLHTAVDVACAVGAADALDVAAKVMPATRNNAPAPDINFDVSEA
ncbi:MAG TPA: hypothetical protein VIJ40_08870 [Acidimicrobiales bacterium]